MQRCGTGAGTGIRTAGTVTFCLCGTETVMHSGYGSGTGFGLGSNIKCNTKVKNLKLEANFLGKNAAFSIES
jgi:hypothetical protein